MAGHNDDNMPDYMNDDGPPVDDSALPPEAFDDGEAAPPMPVATADGGALPKVAPDVIPDSQALVPAGDFDDDEDGFDDDEDGYDEEDDLVPLGMVLEELAERSKATTSEAVKELLPNTRTPPNAIDAERALLGGLLIEPEAVDRVIDVGLRPDQFYRKAHGVIFKAIQDLFARTEPIDVFTVVEELLRKGQLELVGGAAAVSQLEALVPTAAHVGAYAKLISEKATLRALIETCTKLVEASYEQADTVQNLLDKAESSILAISEQTTRKGIVPMRELVKLATEQLEAAYNNQSAVTGVPTGFRDLDKLTAGFQPGDLVIVAARPSMGKTAFTLNVATHAALRAQAAVAFFSLEMGADQLVQRLLGAEARIDISALRKGFIQRHEWAQLAQAAGELGEAAIFIDETPSISVAEMRTKCRKLKAESDIQMIIIDYLQLMTGPPGFESNKAAEVGEISKGLKTIARELSVPVIALSQLNRGVESRTDKRPMMSDLRESGAIEQDADLISFLYREEYYLKDKTPEDKLGMAEIIIAKHRNGPVGSVELRFFNSITRFEDLARDDEYAP